MGGMKDMIPLTCLDLRLHEAVSGIDVAVAVQHSVGPVAVIAGVAEVATIVLLAGSSLANMLMLTAVGS